ncbi:MAG: hypothetical protein WAW96_04120, partial [Alphaproteobacteria bacterium]
MATETNPVSIEFTLNGPAWIFCKVTVGEQSKTFKGVSDAARPLDELLLAAFKILTGESYVTFSFDGEPAETRWVMKLAWLERPPRFGPNGEVVVAIRILRFLGGGHGLPDEAGEEQFSFDCTPEQFAHAAAKAVRNVWERYGQKGYDDAVRE